MFGIKTPYFWKSKIHPFTLLLLPFSLIYFLLIKFNKFTSIFNSKLKIKIICVGNLYLGGTGKTPLVKIIYDELKKKERCCILKKLREKHYDEIKLLNIGEDLFTPKKRIDGLKDAELKGYKTVVIDDGMQDYSFKKDISILCIKSKTGFGNELVLPSGPLREPLKEIEQYKIAVINGIKNEKINDTLKKYNPDIKIFYSHYEIKNIEEFYNKKFLAFSGIGDNDSFFEILKKNNIEILDTVEFKDHHKFTEKEILKLFDIANNKNLKLITTDKNYNNIPEKYKKIIYSTSIKLIIDSYNDFLNEIN